MENSFSNLNIDFAIDSNEYIKLINQFNNKIKKNARWVQLLNKEKEIYLMRLYRNRRFFYFKAKKQIITSEHVIAWTKLINNGVKSANIAKIYHLDLETLNDCLFYYKQNEKNINKSRILL